MARKRWDLTDAELAALASKHNVSEIARLTGFSNPTVDRYLAKAGLRAQPYQSQWHGMTDAVIQWECRRHGLSDFRRAEKNGKFDSYKCVQCTRRNSKTKRLRARQHWIEKAGGHCVDCGIDDWRVLQFHHRDPTTKEFAVGGRLSYESANLEVEKCDLLCANCHVIRHFAYDTSI